MPLIDGIGDEVTHFFVALFVVIVVMLAWWTTNISEQRHVRTVLLLERRRHRSHRRLTNHTETVTIAEGTTMVSPISEEGPSTGDTSSEEPSTSVLKPPEASTSDEGSTTSAVNAENTVDPDPGEEENIIETMDSDACVLRQRRLAFYDNWTNSIHERDIGESQTSTQSADVTQSSTIAEDLVDNMLDSSDQTVMEHNYADRSNTASTISNNDTENIKKQSNNSSTKSEDSKSGITIKLKYINDDLKLVDGRLEEKLGDFKRRHFELELAANKLVRLIFNGQVLQPDTQTLRSCGFFDNCVVHCLIHQKRTQSNETVTESRDGYSFPTSNGIPNLNNNNQNRDWDLGNFLFAFISFILLAAWYFRYVYAHLYTVTATVGLILITGIFTIVLVGMYFPDNEHLPNPTIRRARERVQPQQ